MSMLRTVFSALLWVCLGYTITNLWNARASVGGVDFFFYLSTSRDQALGIPGAPLARYFYFPGVNLVWSCLIRLFGDELLPLQTAYLAAIIANAGLVGAICLIATRCSWCGLLASTIYLFSAVYAEGLEGCTEIFCTVPFLLGLMAWFLNMKRGRSLYAVTSLAIAAALSLFMKQQSALLLLGLVAFIPMIRLRRGGGMHGVGDICAASAVFVIVFLGLFFVEGGGWTALLRGIRAVGIYEQRGSLSNNFRGLVPFLPFTGTLAVGAIIWMVSLTKPRQLGAEERLVGTIIGVCLLGGIATLYQFSTRGYLHYALLTCPSIAIVSSIAIFHLARSILRSSGRTLTEIIMLALLVAVCVIPLAIYGNKTAPLLGTMRAAKMRTTKEAEMQPFRELCAAISTGSELFIFPPRRNIIHWYCKTKSTIWPWGYGWPAVKVDDYEQVLASESLQAVFVVSEAWSDYNTAAVQELKGAGILSLLHKHGFQLFRSFDSGSLFVRSSQTQAVAATH